MKKLTVVVEGKGDVSAASSLVARIGVFLRSPMVVVGTPIKSGEAKKLNRAGELERFIELALRRSESSEVLLLLDLDDGCAAEFQRNFSERIGTLEEQYCRKVHICFCVKEFESWFLSSIDSIREGLSEYRIAPEVSFPNAENTRGAKEALSRVCQGKRYRESRDQSIFVKKIDVAKAYRASRSFRHLIKSLSGDNYDNLEEIFRE